MKLISIYLLTYLVSVSDAQVSFDEARSLIGNSCVTVLDIREPDEHATSVAKGMKLIPMSTLESRLNELPRNPNSRVLFNWQHTKSLKCCAKRTSLSRIYQCGVCSWRNERMG